MPKKHDDSPELSERHVIYTDALDKSLEIFVSHTEKAFENVMSNGLWPIAEAAGLDRIIVFRIFGLESNTAGEIYRWDKALGGTTSIDPSLRALPITATLKHWISIVSDDTCISLRQSEFTEGEAAFLSPRGVKSILIVPVFTERELWGVITFHDNTSERDFDKSCTGLLRSAARLCAATIIRDEKTKAADQAMEALKYHEKITDTLNKAAAIFLSQSEKKFEDTLAAGVKMIVDMANLDRLVLYRNHTKPDGLHMSQVYRWDRDSGGTADLINSYLDVTYAKLMPDWERYLANGAILNSPIKLLPENETAILSSFNIVSVAIIPVFINTDFWGFALFGDVHNERYFGTDIIEMLRSAVFLLANAFVRAEMESTVANKNLLLDTMNSISAIMLQSEIANFESALYRCMGIMAEAVNVDRVYIWRNHTVNGELHCTQLYEWATDVAPQQGTEYTVDIKYSTGIPGWEETLSHKNCIKGLVRDLSQAEQAQLSPQGIISIMVVPVFLQNKFWGFVGFDDCQKERMFSENEEMILRSASQLFANALIRNENAVKAHEAEERTRLMLDSTPLCCQIWDKNFNTIDCNEAAVKLYGFKSKQEYIERFQECSPEYQSDGRRSNEKAQSLVQKAFSEGYCLFEWTHQMPDGMPIPAEITLVRVKYGDDYVVAGYTRDLRYIKTMENNILNLEKEVDKIYYDPLTGIYNRRFFDESLSRIIKSLSRSGSELSLMMIDIDFFKNYNDTYGHSEGDKCLITIAETLANTLTRNDDYVARYGGEEFVVVLPNTGEEGARMMAEKLLENVRSCNIPHESSSVAKYVTISIGVMTGIVEHTRCKDDYLRHADAMLYESKRNGRDRYFFKGL